MARIVPKLNLNRTPQSVDNMSLVFAKNIKLRKDNTIGRDNVITGITPLPDFRAILGWQPTFENMVGYIPYNNNLYLLFGVEDNVPAENPVYPTRCKLNINLYGNAIYHEAEDGGYDWSDEVRYKFSDYVDISYSNDLNKVVTITLKNYSPWWLGEDSNNNPIIMESYVITGHYNDSYTTIDNIQIPTRILTLETGYGRYFSEGIEKELNSSINTTINILAYTYKYVINGAFRENVDQTRSGYSSFIITFYVNATINEVIPTISRPSAIVEYDEITNSYKLIPSAWTYNYGEISGICRQNLRGERLLTIAENNTDLKTININKSAWLDNESIYTQTPEIPIASARLINKYDVVIPKGVYQFFIRFEIHKEHYTNWAPLTVPLFAITKSYRDTVLGTVMDNPSIEDAAYSFLLSLDIEDTFYERYQIGFILTTKDTTVARKWKTFNINNRLIQFDYNNIEEIELKDILQTPYKLYNIDNITSFKNKTYISNYNETDYSPNITCYNGNNEVSLANAFTIDIATKLINDEITEYKVNNTDTICVVDDNNYVTLIGTENPQIYNNINNKYRSDITKAQYEGDQYNVNVTNELADIKVDGLTLTITSKYNHNYEHKLYAVALDSSNNVIASKMIEYNKPIKDYIIDIDGSLRQSDSLLYKNERVISTIQVPLDSNGHYIVIEYQYDEIIGEPTTNDPIADNEQTLIPGQYYAFYVHFITKYGEITNGYYLNKIKCEWSNNDLENVDKIYKYYAKITCNIDKVISDNIEFNGFFISIAKVDNLIIEAFHSIYHDDRVLNVLESDLLIHPLDKCKVKYYDTNAHEFKEVNATYLSSMQLDNTNIYRRNEVNNFGALVLDNTINSSNTTNLHIEIPYIRNNDIIELKAITIFHKIEYNKKITSNYCDSWVCRVTKPNNKTNSDRNVYVAGTNAYTISVTADNISLNKINYALGNHSTEVHIVRSNYNLNAIELTENLVTQIRSYENNNTPGKELIIPVNSALGSDIYSLNAMYKDYVQKTYNAVDETLFKLTRFENTIRSSELIGDESEQYVVKFAPEDYYNVPTDKGKITNLKAIGDIILVHTQDSLYKFTGKAKLTTSEDNVQVEESDPFDTGIQELFGSDFGFAGLASKFHSFASQFGYIWWDKDCGVIYLYAGEGQLAPISDPIHKLLKSLNITNIKFGGDFYNDRFFICIEYLSDDERFKQYITLSYNVKAKSFVSLHDFYFNECINTKAHTYFINILNLNADSTDRFGKILTIIDEEGPYDIEYVENRDDKYPTYGFYNDVKHGYETGSVVDIIFNADYETIKTLNAISWICNKIESFFSSPVGEHMNYPLMAAEEKLNSKYPGNHLMIYTDSCRTNYIGINDNAANYMLYKVLQGVNNLKDITREDMEGSAYVESYPYFIFNSKIKSKVSQSFEKPTFNLGKWTFNYFRNVLNAGNNPNFDTQSLIIGKYFVVRFIFDDNVNFKLENLDINYDTTK